MADSNTSSKHFHPEPVRRAPQFGGLTPEERAERAPDSKKLIVGKEINLNGEITACEQLIVEGTVDATLTRGKYVEISKGGVFKGAADVDEAEISGRFEGQLVVRNRLVIRAGGSVSGDLEYGEIEIQRGGQIIGTVRNRQEGEVKTVAPAPSIDAAE
ncbi:MAG: polymer-forming cytoskeletal protein [Proteobacteria bacterium]|nr:polymer-forming cytoskeletal protein [Pseudomonadota bacterium]